MPIYDFKCLDCGKVTEFISLVTDDSYNCPECGSNKLDRLISSPALLKSTTSLSGKTCCGREERCETPACSTGEQCRRH